MFILSMFKMLLSVAFVTGTVFGIVFLLYVLLNKEKKLKFPQFQFDFQIAVAVADTIVLSVLGFPLMVIAAVMISATLWIVETAKKPKALISSLHK